MIAVVVLVWGLFCFFICVVVLLCPRLSSSPEDQGLFRTKNYNDEEVLAAIQVEQVTQRVHMYVCVWRW